MIFYWMLNIILEADIECISKTMLFILVFNDLVFQIFRNFLWIFCQPTVISFDAFYLHEFKNSSTFWIPI